MLPDRPRRYRDETARYLPGDVEYVLALTDEEVEKLAGGRVPSRVMDRAYEMLKWKREAAQDWGSTP